MARQTISRASAGFLRRRHIGPLFAKVSSIRLQVFFSSACSRRDPPASESLLELRYYLAMRSFIYLLQLLSISCSSPSVAEASIGSAANADLSPLRLPYLSDIKANCVSGNQWVEWRGDIDHTKCRAALDTLKAKVPRDHGYVFWSGTIRTRPPPLVPWPYKLPGQSDSGKLCKDRKPYNRTLALGDALSWMIRSMAEFNR